MTLREKLVWLATWLAPAGWCAALALFGLVVAFPSLKQLNTTTRLDGWLLAAGACVSMALVAHMLVEHHGATAPHFSIDEKAELRSRLRTGRGYAHWRGLMRRHGKTWQKGRSRSGARPRYD